MAEKIVLTNEQLQQIKALFDKGMGTRMVGKIMGIGRTPIKSAFEQLGLANKVGRVPLKVQIIPTDRECRTCEKTFPIANFRSRIRDGQIEYEYHCLPCESENNKTHAKEYNAKPETKVKRHEYYITNKEILKVKGRIRDRNRRKNDPFYKLRHRVSNSIWLQLKKNDGSKFDQSVADHLPSTIPEMLEHMERMFSHPDNLTPEGKVWMTWDNWGVYDRKTWNDNDYSTRKWRLDHIIPHSDLPYTSMTDDNFKKCWSLDNLRPYSAKRNFLDGNSRVRHKKK